MRTSRSPRSNGRRLRDERRARSPIRSQLSIPAARRGRAQRASSRVHMAGRGSEPVRGGARHRPNVPSGARLVGGVRRLRLQPLQAHVFQLVDEDRSRRRNGRRRVHLRQPDAFHPARPHRRSHRDDDIPSGPSQLRPSEAQRPYIFPAVGVHADVRRRRAEPLAGLRDLSGGLHPARSGDARDISLQGDLRTGVDNRQPALDRDCRGPASHSARRLLPAVLPPHSKIPHIRVREPPGFRPIEGGGAEIFRTVDVSRPAVCGSRD